MHTHKVKQQHCISIISVGKLIVGQEELFFIQFPCFFFEKKIQRVFFVVSDFLSSKPLSHLFAFSLEDLSEKGFTMFFGIE